MRIAFLTQRLPYAPNRGDRVRAYHEVRVLQAAGHEVHLVSLVHDTEEARHVPDLRGLVASVQVCEVPRRTNLVIGATTLLGSRPLTHALLHSPGMGPTLSRLVLDVKPQVVLGFCSSMARYALEPPLDRIPLVLDMVDVDSAKWAALATSARFPLNLVYRREARTLGRFEAIAARRARTTFVVNEREAEALRTLAGVGAAISVVENGVDFERLAPPTGPQPSNDIVFCGVLDYAPNEQAALWLLDQVWRAVQVARPEARLLLVGANPTPRLVAAARQHTSVTVTGSVTDVRPYLWNAAASVAPLLIARGVQNKVLEAVATGLPAVITPVVAAGLPAEVLSACLVAQAPEDFSAAVVRLLSLRPDERRALAESVRRSGMTWEDRLAPLLAAVDRVVIEAR